MTDDEMIDCPDGAAQLDRLRAIMHRLRAPGGCPWDAEQTHASLVSNLIEETYETIDAIQSQDMPHLAEELGDLLLQIVFHAELASEAGHFDLDDVARGISDKLVRRHPHVFANSTAGDTSAVLNQWDAIKRSERGTESEPYLHDVGKGLPALLKAAKLQKKAAKVGFDWPTTAGIFEKIGEELAETQEAVTSGDRDEMEAEIGDLLFIVTNLARKLDINPEAALERTNRKFLYRFGYLESRLEEHGTALTDASLEEMEALWLEAKVKARESRI